MHVRLGRFVSIEYVAFLIWFGLIAFLIERHAIWYDEARAWLIATRTADWSAMLAQTHADGHPALWYVALRAASSIHDSVSTLYAVHCMFAAIAAGFCLALKNLPLSLRLILLFGGILGFEYAVIARNYAPAAAALLAYAYFYPQRDRWPVLLGTLLAAALNFHAGVAPIVPFLMLPWFLELHRDTIRPFVIAAAIVAIGYAALAFSVYPPHPDSVFPPAVAKMAGPGMTDFLPSMFLKGVLTAGAADVVPMENWVPIAGHIVLSAVLIAGTFCLFSQPQLGVCAAGIVLATSAFYGWAYPMTSYRHAAMAVIAVVALLSLDMPRDPPAKRRAIAHRIFRILLLLQFAHVGLGIVLPASSSTAAAAVLSRPEFTAAKLFCVPNHMAQSLAALGVRDCLMDQSRRTGPYPFYLTSDQHHPRASLTEIADWMSDQERNGTPGIVYLHQAFLLNSVYAEAAQERADFVARVDFLLPIGSYLVEERGILLRLKPEYRGASSPSGFPHTDRQSAETAEIHAPAAASR